MASAKGPRKKVLVSKVQVKEAKSVLQGNEPEGDWGETLSDMLRREVASLRPLNPRGTGTSLSTLPLPLHSSCCKGIPWIEQDPLLSGLSWSSYVPCVVSPWDLGVLAPCCGDCSHSTVTYMEDTVASWVVLFPCLSQTHHTDYVRNGSNASRPDKWSFPYKMQKWLSEVPILKPPMEK